VFSHIAKKNRKGDNVSKFFIFTDEIAQNSMEETLFERKDRLNASFSSVVSDDSAKKHSIKEFCKDGRFRRNFIFASFIWTAVVFNYFLLAFYFKYFPGSIFTNSLILAGADMLSYLVSGLIMRVLNTNKALLLA